MKRLALYLLLCLVLAVPALAETSFQFSAAGVQMPDDPSVDGCRISLLFGKNESVGGFDMGLASVSQASTFSGLGLIFGMGLVTGPSSGFSGALINVHSGEDDGVNVAFINTAKTVKGANIGFVNFTDGVSDMDISGLGMSKESKVQVGFVNITKKITTVQLGFLNAAENGLFPLFPFFNVPKK